uniref:Uncharacterized protein n=1 Tax=Romanomermis culicivorax TaxID=13658 RepID=A0A915IE97_ROMCU
MSITKDGGGGGGGAGALPVVDILVGLDAWLGGAGGGGGPLGRAGKFLGGGGGIVDGVELRFGLTLWLMLGVNWGICPDDTDGGDIADIRFSTNNAKLIEYIENSEVFRIYLFCYRNLWDIEDFFDPKAPDMYLTSLRVTYIAFKSHQFRCIIVDSLPYEKLIVKRLLEYN